MKRGCRGYVTAGGADSPSPLIPFSLALPFHLCFMATGRGAAFLCFPLLFWWFCSTPGSKLREGWHLWNRELKSIFLSFFRLFIWLFHDSYKNLMNSNTGTLHFCFILYCIIWKWKDSHLWIYTKKKITYVIQIYNIQNFISMLNIKTILSSYII